MDEAARRANQIRVNQATQTAKGGLSYPAGAYSLIEGTNIGFVKNAVSSADALTKRLKTLGAESSAMWAKLAADSAQGAEASARNLAKVAAAAKVQFNQSLPGAGAYSVSSGTDVGALRNGVSATNDLTSAKGRLRKEMNELHSATRGLASGFGAMWLTWGSILPLMAGAAVSAAFVQTIKLGAEVQDSLTRMRVLGGETAESVGNLSTQLLDLSKTGPFGPREVAEAMKTLTLAGLDAVEVGSSIKDVLNFSLAGDLGVAAAAEALTTIATAFGVSAQGYSYVSDTISKAAAESKSSVESIAEAFKTASVINQQYGVSLEETAVGLSLLANAGIKGTAAGTALRNMYADLSGRTKQVRDTLKDLGVQAFDPLTGKMRKTGDVFKELMLSLESTKSPDQARGILSKIFGERGEKEAFAILEALKTKAKDTTSTVSNLYDELIEKAANASGFAAIAAAEIALTPMNQMKSVTATLQSVLVETFESLQPYILETATNLKAMLNSENFKSGIRDLVVALGEVVTFVVDHGKALATLLLAYSGMKALVTLVGAVSTAYVALTASTVTATSAATGLGLATRAAALANPVLLGLTTAVTLGAAAWAAYELWTNKSADATKKNVDLDTSAFIDNLRSERDRLREINEAHREGISLEDLRLSRQGKVAASISSGAVEMARDKVERMRAAVASGELDAPAKKMIVGQLPEAEKALMAAHDRHIANLRDVRETKEEVRKEGEELAKYERAQAKLRLEANAGRFKGTGGVEDDAKKGAKERLNALVAYQNKELDQVKAYYASEASVVKAEEDAKKTLLKSERDNLIISSGAFHAQEIMATAAAEKAQLDLITSSLGKAEKARDNTYAGAHAHLQEWLAANAGMKGDKSYAAAERRQYDALVKSITGANQEFNDFVKTQGDAAKKIENGAMVRLKLQANEAAGELNKLTKSSKEFWDKEAENTAKNARKDNLDDMLRYASPEARAYLEAAATEQERYAEKVLEVEKQIKLASDAYFDYAANMQSAAVMTEELSKGELSQIEILKKLEAERAKLNATMGASADTAGRRAVETFAKNEEAALIKSVAGAIETGIFEGGKAGSKSLRKIITDQLRKPITMFIQASVQTLVGAITGGGGGVAGAANTVNAGSSLLSGASSIASLYNVASTTMSGLVSGATTIGGILSTSAAGVSTALSYGTAIGSTQTAMLLAQEAGMGLASSMGSLGAAFAAVPVWGWIAAGVAALAIALDDSGTPHTGGSAAYSSGGGLKLDASKELDFNVDRTQTATDGAASIAMGIVGLLDKTALTFGKEAGYYAATAFADDTSKDGAWGALKIKLGDSIVTDWGKGNDSWPGREFGNGEDGVKGYAKALAVDVRNALDGIGLPDWATLMLDNLGEAPSVEKLAETVEAITQIQKVSEFFGETLGFSTEALSGLISTLGGASSAFSALGSYYQNFYTEEERRAKLVETTEGAFKKLGLTMPALDESARANFRSMMDTAAAQDMTVVANRAAYASLLALEPAMNEISLSFEALAEVAATRTDADIRMLTAQGRAQEALTLQRKQDIQTMSEAQVAAYDYAAAIDRSISLSSAQGKVRSTMVSISAQVAGFAAASSDAAKVVQESQRAIAQGYGEAQTSVAQAQQRVTDLSRAAADKMMAFSKTIGDFLGVISPASGSGASLNSLKAQLSSTAVLARAGDSDAQDRLLKEAQDVLDAAKASSGTRLEFDRSEAFVRSLLTGVQDAVTPKLADLSPKEAESQMAEAVKSLADAQKTLAEYSAIALATGTDLDAKAQKATQTLLDSFNEATLSSAKAQADYTAALTLTQGLRLSDSSDLNALLESFAQLGAAQKSVAEISAAMVEADKLAADAAIDLVSGLAGLDLALGLTGSAAEQFNQDFLDSGLTIETFDAILAATGVSAEVLAATLGLGNLSVAEAASGLTLSVEDAATALTLSSTASGALTDTISATSTSAVELSDALFATRVDAASLSGQVLETSTSAGDLSDALLATGGDAASLSEQVLETEAAALTLEGQLGKVESASDTLEASLGDTGLGLGSLDRAVGGSRDKAIELGRQFGLTDAAILLFEGKVGTAGGGLTALSGQFGLTLLEASRLAGAFGGASTASTALGGLTNSATTLGNSFGLVAAAAASLATALSKISAPAPTSVVVPATPAEAATTAATTGSAVNLAYQKLFGRDAEASGVDYWKASGLTGSALFEAIRAGAQGPDIAARDQRGFAVDPINLAYQTLFGRNAEASGLAGWKASGLTGSALFEAIRAGAQGPDIVAKKLRGFAIGTSYVPNDMTARIHQGEEITPRPYVDQQRASRDETNALLARLVQSNAELRAELGAIRASSASSEASNRDTSDNLKLVTQNGRAMKTVAFV